MSKFLPLLSCLLLLANSASAAGGQQTSLEDIEREYSPKQPSYTPKASTSEVSSPTKFGFVPQRTASSYAAVKPKYQYTQANYQVKRPQSQYKNSAPRQQHYSYQQPQQTVQYVSQEQYLGQQQSRLSLSQQQPQQTVQYVNQQPTVEYVNQQQPEQYMSQQHYPGQYLTEATGQYSNQQPSNYDQYENVQYVSDNSIGQQPQFYYVQQYQAPSSSVESVVDPKGLQYLYVPSYVSNSIPTTNEKYSVPNEKYSLPSVVKYATKGTAKHSSGSSQRYSQSDDILVKRQPKSLLDSYVPSRVQLQYLMQQGKY